MDARELRDDLSPHRNASWTIIGDEDRATILRALDLLAAVEGSQDELVRELQLRVRGQRGEVANCMNKAAAALVAELAAKEKAEAERDEAMRVLKLANDSCRSAYQVAARKGSETEWETWQFALQKSLNEQHRVMYPEQYSEDRRIRAHDLAARPKDAP